MPSVLCYGDSNTHGTPPLVRRGPGWVRYDRNTRWPGVMAAHLGAEWVVIEEGLPGRTTVHDDAIEGPHRNGLTVLPAILESHGPVDLLILMLGTNDCKQRFSLTGLDIALGVNRLIDCVEASRLTGSMLIIAPPVVDERGCLAEIFQGGRERSQGVGPHLRKICLTRHLPFLDAAEIVQTDPVDGVHLSEASHKKLGLEIAERARKIVG